MRTFVVSVLAALVCALGGASDWPKYCANLELTGVAQSAGNISVTSARNLTLRWSLAVGGPIASSPTIVDGRLYVGDWSGFEWAVDAGTGRVLGAIDLGTSTLSECNPSSLGITSSPAVDGGTLFVAGGDDFFYAIDPQTMTVQWKQQLGDTSSGYYGWCSPAVAEGFVFQGVSSNCDTPFVPGRLVALNRNGGEIVSEGTLMPQDGPSNTLGGGVWTSPAIDSPNQSVFVTTGSALQLSDGHAFSIVRLSLVDLRVMDSWKIDTVQTVDSDWGTSPTLFTDAEGRQLVGAGQKSGGYYAFNRSYMMSGPLWETPIARPGNCPQCGDGILSTAAFDGQRLYLGSGQPIGDTTHLGAVTALDPTDGHVIWQTAFASPVIAPISYANGVLFTTTGKSLVALNAANGAILATFVTRGECVGGVAITDEGIFFGDLSGMLYNLGALESPPRRRSVIGR